MSFIHLISLIPNSSAMSVTIDPPLILYGDYELGIIEFDIDVFRVLLGYISTENKQFNLFLPNIQLDNNGCSKLHGVNICLKNKIATITNEKAFFLDGIQSDSKNSFSVELYKYKIIHVVANIVETTNINGKPIPLLKRIVYNQQHNPTEYFTVNTRYINKIELRFLDYKFENIFTYAKQHYFILHFRKK